MDYAEGGSLWDVLESSFHDSRISESAFRWWMPQVVSAIQKYHEQGFIRRYVVHVVYFARLTLNSDRKPYNSVPIRDAHVLLIDFGPSAPLLPPGTTNY